MARAYYRLAVPIPLLMALAVELAAAPSHVTIMPAPVPAARIISAAAPDPRIAAAVMLARPLFSPRRRPANAVQRPAAQAPRLSGIVVTGAGRYAIFAPDGGPPIIAAKGQLIGPYTIREITTTQVILSGPNGIFTLRTSLPAAASGAAPPPAATPPHPPGPINLPGGITLYPATKQNLPDAADWPGPKD